MTRTLIIGYGNPDRGDDGVAYHVVNALRLRRGQLPLEPTATGLEDLGGRVDTVFLLQLVPELIETIRNYDRVIFVDAHVGERTPQVDCQPVVPEFTLSAFTHHLTPGAVLALAGLLSPAPPQGYVVSVKGHEFEFGQSLSSATYKLLNRAIACVEGLLTQG